MNNDYIHILKSKYYIVDVRHNYEAILMMYFYKKKDVSD